MSVFNRLYVKVYLTIVLSLILAVIATAAIFRAGPEAESMRGAFHMAGGVLTAALADKAAPLAQQKEAVDRLSRLIHADLALFTEDGQLIAASGEPLPPPDQVTNGAGDRWFRGPHRSIWRVPLGDGRLVVFHSQFDREHHGFGLGFFGHLAIVALLLALVAYPVVRGLTRRLEQLQAGVEQFGAGNLATRVDVRGGDEVAKVAESFNRAATRVEELVKAHKMLLANTSHELRTPLTRLRMSIELLKDKADPARKAELEQDIAELNQLIDEILLSSRLDAMEKLETVEDVDLLALAAEEAAHYDSTTVSGTPVNVRGDSKLLRRLVRNLLDNAARHGAPPVEVSVTANAATATLTIADHGTGIPDADRERIFEPFFRRAGAPATGAGLGLALVRQIARRHGGEASVAKLADGRAAFILKLPQTPT